MNSELLPIPAAAAIATAKDLAAKEGLLASKICNV